jgi:hypothetical protein
MIAAAQKKAAAKAAAYGDLDQEALDARRKKLMEIKAIPGRLTVKLVGGRYVAWWRRSQGLDGACVCVREEREHAGRGALEATVFSPGRMCMYALVARPSGVNSVGASVFALG